MRCWLVHYKVRQTKRQRTPPKKQHLVINQAIRLVCSPANCRWKWISNKTTVIPFASLVRAGAKVYKGYNSNGSWRIIIYSDSYSFQNKRIWKKVAKSGPVQKSISAKKFFICRCIENYVMPATQNLAKKEALQKKSNFIRRAKARRHRINDLSIVFIVLWNEARYTRFHCICANNFSTKMARRTTQVKICLLLQRTQKILKAISGNIWSPHKINQASQDGWFSKWRFFTLYLQRSQQFARDTGFWVETTRLSPYDSLIIVLGKTNEILPFKPYFERLEFFQFLCNKNAIFFPLSNTTIWLSKRDLINFSEC